ncbi:hypothetical protein NE237_026320 [Protea cynaroides]|uniref:Uncharacterized protein n=1 Tax=Protea cynaroides TaxID=273540 RepID=A0A9Q0K0D4_9MAGN|nr:hypothetical protein NE237_026320 [Protea cynaroides]
MIIDTTKAQAINSFSRLESLKEAYELIWLLVPIFSLVSGITIGVLVIVWLEREISVGIQQRILQALADGTKLLCKGICSFPRKTFFASKSARPPGESGRRPFFFKFCTKE